MPLVTTFAGDSARGEGLFSASSGAPKNKFVYVNSTNYLYKVNTTTFTVTSTINSIYRSSGYCPMLIDPAGLFGYLIGGPDTITKIDLTTFAISATLTTSGLGGNTGVIDPSGTYLYVGNNNSAGVIYKYNLATFTYVGSLTGFGGDISNMCIDSSGTYLYATTNGVVGLYKVNLSTFTITTSSGNLGYGAFYYGLCIDNSNNIYVGTSNSSVIKFSSGNVATVSTSINVNGPPINVILDSTQSNLLACDQSNSLIYKIPVSLGAGYSNNSYVTSAFGVTCDSLGTYAYVTGATGSASTSTINRITLSTFTGNGSINGAAIGMSSPYGITMDFYTNNPR
jgi:DNA-binding beta-propeller fold protein YncE